MLEQMAHFLFNGRRDTVESGQNRWLQPQKPLLKQIRSSAHSSDSYQRRLQNCQWRMWTHFHTFHSKCLSNKLQTKETCRVGFHQEIQADFFPRLFPAQWPLLNAAYASVRIADTDPWPPRPFHGVLSQIFEGSKFTWVRHSDFYFGFCVYCWPVLITSVVSFNDLCCPLQIRV